MPADPMERVRVARTMSDLLSAVSAAGHGDLLEKPLLPWLDTPAGQLIAPAAMRGLLRAGTGGTLGAALRSWGYTDPHAVTKVRDAVVAACPRAKPSAPRERLHPGMDMQELRAWALENDVAGWLNVHVSRVVSPYHSDAAWAWHVYQERWTLGFLITTPSAAGTASTTQPPASLQNAAIAALRQVAADLKHARQTPQPLPAPPADARLRRTWDQLARLATELPFNAPLARAEHIGIGEEPPRIAVTFPPSGLCANRGHRRVLIDLDGPEPALSCDCPVNDATHCGAARLACREAVNSMSAHGSLAAYAPLAAALGRPPWERALRALDEALATPAPEPRTDLIWLLNRESYGAFGLRPGRLKQQKKGVKPVGMEWRELRDSDDALSAMDRRVLRALVPHEHGFPSGRTPMRETQLVIGALRQLIGTERLYDAATAAPIAVVEGELAVDLARAVNQVSFALRIANQPLSFEAFKLAVRQSRGGHEMVVGIGDTLYLVGMPQRTLKVIEALHERGGRMQVEALPELVRRLPMLTDSIGLQPSPELAAETRSLLPSLRARLAVVPEGLSCTIRVAGPGGEPLVPGAGPAHAFTTRGDELVAHARNFAAELEAAAALLERIRPGAVTEQWTFVEPDPERGLDVVAALQTPGEGVAVEWSTQPRSVTRAATAKDLKIEVGKKRDWFAAGGELEVDGVRVPLGELLRLMREGRGYVPVGADRWVRIEATLRERLRRLAAQAGDSAGGVQLGPSDAELLEELQGAGAGIETGAAWGERVRRIREAVTLDLPVPDDISADLRSYQVDGFRFLARLAHWSEGGVLADDMGLGKTLQAIVLLSRRAALGPALVVAPTSVGFNWVRECARFAPSLKVRLLRGAERAVGNVGPGDVLVTSYDLLVRDVEPLGAVEFATLVLDEAQAIKNATTKRARAALEIQAEFRVALTGTPVENRLAELWSLFRAVQPGLFGSWESFRTRWGDPIERSGDTSRRRELAARIRPFILRRLKGEVARELPPRTEVREDVVLSAEERKRYDNVRSATLAALAGLDPDTPAEKRRFQVLAALTRLRQLACDPALVDPEWKSGSAKLSRLSELVEELVAEERRVLVFSQYTSLLDRVQGVLTQRLLRIDGSTPEKERRERVDAFQRGEADVFLLSLKAGGTGLNLTAASDVVILDPWWNPAVEDQAADRAHRIGQTRAVTIYRLVTCETVEEQMLEMHAAKRDLVAGVLEGTGSGGSLGVEELMALLRQ